MSPKKAEKKITVSKNEPLKQASLFSRIRWGESYVSLLLGALVVIIAAVLGFFYVKVNQPKQELLPPATISRSVKPTITPEVGKKQEVSGQTYTVQKDDNLWSIAEKVYGSGYSWISIARANNLTNPGVIHSGNVLVIPSVTPILVQGQPQQILPTLTPTKTISPSPKPTTTPMPTMQPKQMMHPDGAITGERYTIIRGDSLWSIAVHVYGNGDKWRDIAKANHLTNPGLIHSGNVLIIPH